MDYGLSHHCTGIAPLVSADETAPPPTGFSPGYYLALALNIVRWDDVAIRRASRDPHATYYGAVFWGFAAVIIMIGATLPVTLQAFRLQRPEILVSVAIAVILGLLTLALMTFVQLGMCHLIAKWFFGGSGTYLGVMRPLLLAWFVNCLILIPFVGILASGIAWTAVLMMVFEEVDGIGRLQAFGISAGINFCFIALQFMIRAARHL